MYIWRWRRTNVINVAWRYIAYAQSCMHADKFAKPRLRIQTKIENCFVSCCFSWQGHCVAYLQAAVSLHNIGQSRWQRYLPRSPTVVPAPCYTVLAGFPPPCSQFFRTYRSVRIKRPGVRVNRIPLNRGVGARCVLRVLRHVVSAHPFSTV